MKKWNWILLAMLVVFVPVWQACDDNDGYSVGDMAYDLATVRAFGGGTYHLEGDHWGTIIPVTPDPLWYRPVDGKRVFVYFNPLYDNYQGYDVAVKMDRINNILTKPIEDLTAENEEEYGNDPVAGNFWISNGYLNVVFRQYLPVSTPHRVSLVQNKTVEPENDGYIHLEYRYNTYGDGITNWYTDGAMVCFNLNSLEITPETKGIKVKVNSKKDGEVEILFELKNQPAPELLQRVTSSEVESAKMK